MKKKRYFVKYLSLDEKENHQVKIWEDKILSKQ